MLVTGYRRRPAQPLDNRHRIGKAVQRVPAGNSVLVNQRVDLGPIGLEPAGRDAEGVEKRRQPICA